MAPIRSRMSDYQVCCMFFPVLRTGLVFASLWLTSCLDCSLWSLTSAVVGAQKPVRLLRIHGTKFVSDFARVGGCFIAPCLPGLSVEPGTRARAHHRYEAASILMVSRGFSNLLHSKLNLTMISFFRPSKVRLHVLSMTVSSFWTIPNSLHGVASDDVVPATPWGFQEIQDLVPRCSAVTFALYQCHFGSSTSKPTRFLGNLPQWRTSVPHCAGFASLDSQGRYKGPLPPRCGHKHASLLRAQSDGWHAGASPRFPAELCDFIASAIAAVAPSGMGGSQTPACNKSLVVGPPAVFPPGSPLSSTGSSLESMPQEHPSTYTTGDAANLDDPDAFAENILRSGAEVSREHILEMYKLLPKERPSRASEDAEDPGTSFSVGVYFHAGSVGLRHHTRLLPNCAKLLCAYWRRELPQHSFSTISLFENVRTSLHKDGRNGTCYNAIVAVSDFVRGGLWLEDKDGDVVREVNGESVRGRVHPVVSVPFIFEARDRYRCTEPWEGQRLVMVAFTVPECEKLDKDDAAFVVDLGFPIKGKAADVDHAIPFRPELCGNYGIPVKVSWAGSEGPLTDGFGLCSPSRWTPSARGARLGETARRFASAMHTLVKSFVLRVTPDPERTAMELVLGRYTSSPFSEKDMAQLRKQWVSLLGDSQGFDLLEVPERQPFFLPALARTAELLEDPDWEIVTQGNDNFCTGVPLGCEEICHRFHKSLTLSISLGLSMNPNTIGTDRTIRARGILKHLYTRSSERRSDSGECFRRLLVR